VDKVPSRRWWEGGSIPSAMPRATAHGKRPKLGSGTDKSPRHGRKRFLYGKGVLWTCGFQSPQLFNSKQSNLVGNGILNFNSATRCAYSRICGGMLWLGTSSGPSVKVRSQHLHHTEPSACCTKAGHWP
jgi:hypothetical protein